MTHLNSFVPFLSRPLLVGALAAALLMAPAAVVAQTPITLTAAGHNIAPGRVNNWQQVRPAPGALPRLVAGPNQAWDYRALTPVGAPYTRAFAPALVNAAYPVATLGRAYTVALGPLLIQGDQFNGFTGAGFVEFGAALAAQAFSLGSFSGNPSDSLAFPAQNLINTPPLVLQELPSTAGTTQNQFRRLATTFRITVGAFGISRAPGRYVQRFTHLDSVIAWGTIRVPVAGQPGGSAPVPVLLRRSYIIEQDSFYVAGQPAPPALLAALGLTQGASSRTVFDSFLRESSPQPVAQVSYLNAARTQGEIYVSAEANLPLRAPALLTEAEAALWPNPVIAGEAVRVDINGLTQRVPATLHDGLGRVVFAPELHPGGALPLPAALAPGTYLLAADLPDGRLLRRRVVVK